MKTGRFIFFIGSLLWVISCSDDPYVRDYPEITSSGIKSISEQGVTLEATTGEKFREIVIDHGFVWSQGRDLRVDTAFTVHLGLLKDGRFTSDIRTELLAEKKYYARAFLKTSRRTIFGVLMEFVSKGSEGVIIESISPEVVVPGDEVTITGQLFGTDKNKIAVAFRAANESEQGFVDYDATIKSVEETKIVVTVPFFLTESTSIAITRAGNNTVVSSMAVVRRMPKLTGITSASLCGDITITGENLKVLGEPDIYVSGLHGATTVTDNSIVLSKAFHMQDLYVSLDYDTEFGTYSVQKTFKDPAPYPTVTGNIPATVPASSMFVLDGANFPTCDGLSVFAYEDESPYFPETMLELVSATSTQVTIKYLYPSCRSFKIQFKYHDRLIYTSPTIDKRPFTVTSVTPDHGTIGTQITVKGTNLNSIEARLGRPPDNSTKGEPMGYVSWSETETVLEVSFPNNYGRMYTNPDGTTTLTLDKCSETVEWPLTLDFPEVTFTDYSPKNNTASSQVTVTGANFSADPNLRAMLEQANSDSYYVWDLVTTDTQLTFTPAASRNYSGYSVPSGSYKLAVYYFGKRYEFPQSLQLTR
jgi:hypothetical protein